MNKILEEKANIIIDLCCSITRNLSYQSDGDTYKKYNVPVNSLGTSFSITLNNYHFEQRIIYNDLLIDLNIYKIRNWKTGEYEVSIKFLDCDNPFFLEEDIVSNILSELISVLKESAMEHEYKEPPAETIMILQELCAKDVRILLHGTDLEKVEKILKQGLKIWDLGSSCRTTTMIANDYKKILAYNYADKCFRPRNIIFAIPNSLFPNTSPKTSSEKKTMEKCKSCTARIHEGYDAWCYQENYIYEKVACETDIGWVIPPEYIYGYLDYNGNFIFNEQYDPVLKENSNQHLLKKKLNLN